MRKALCARAASWGGGVVNTGCRRLLGGGTGTSLLTAGKTQQAERGRGLHRRGHSVSGVVDLVFVGIQSFGGVHVVP